ncbi:MAG: preprotein translocase subunit SecY [Eubacteriales bacterium]
MLQTLKNAWNTPDLRRKILFVLFILLLYRIGTVIPVPFVDASSFTQNFGDTIFAYMDVLSGGALSSATLFALGISPYITASIIIQLLTVAFPALERKFKGEGGKELSNKWTRIATVALAIVTGFGYYTLLKNNDMLSDQITGFGKGMNVLSGIVIVTCYVAGASIIMWLGEKINENGIGNGISLILFANIVSGSASFAIRLVRLVIYAIDGEATKWSAFWYILLGVVFALFILFVILAMVYFVVFITGSERRVPVQYAKRVVGRKMYGGQNTHLPIKLNMTGVMPVIFASSIISLPATAMTLFGITGTGKGFWDTLARFFAPDAWFYPVALFLLIIGFAYFYTNISFNPIDVANNLKKNGGMIPGIRQGKPTVEYIQRILRKITLVGALFLGVIAVLPVIASPLLMEPVVTKILANSKDFAFMAGDGSSYYASYFRSVVSQFTGSFAFGGTSLLIVVGVVQETFRELEAQLTMRNYKGFL